ncbi:putative disease resistance protein RGA3 isoform X2 [Castanea sativa]|uniref:putative disease resistance protein RGA3 isoform X2 n=1 Tax=Castanea sativa TaxID=21020 RepID=UPI003F64AFDF
MVRKKDRFWEHVEKQNNGRFKCKYCESIFAGGATRIKYHLAGAKCHDINICTKVPKEVQEEASLTIGEPNKKLKGASTSNKDKEREISSASISNDDMIRGVFEKNKAEYIAEILLGVFVEGLLAKLRSIVVEQHISFNLGFKEGLIDLLTLLTQIQLVLNDAEKRQASDDFVRSWLAEFRLVAYDIDDVLDELGYNILQQKVLNYSLPSNDIINMANKIKIINESLNRLKGDIPSDLRAEFVNLIPEISFNMEIDSFLDDSVIEITKTLPQYKLYNCWLIFKKRAFANERLLTPDLKKIGQEIAKKCKRVPWAARFLGGIMYFIHNKDEWLSIQNNKNLDLLDNDNDGVFHTLKLGYNHLPTPSLKRCFTYCAIFPKDYAMKKDEVIQHWMAEGFLKPSKEGNMVMEDIGNTYFNILLATSFFQNATKDAYGNIISCKMHDLVHDFAISISKSEILILDGDSVDNISKVQPLFVRFDDQTTPEISFTEDGFTKLRTLVSENVGFGNMLSNFKCLRVLKLSDVSTSELPDSIEQLIHLRFLHISRAKIVEIPKSITKLYNLQTLRIEDCCNLTKLPEDLSDLINLRHIYIDHFKRLGYKIKMPENMGRLSCLHTLPFFFLDQDGHLIKELGHLNNLRGELDIYNLQYVRGKEEARSANLAKNAKIFKLGFHWGARFGRARDDYDNDEEVLEGLKPHRNLKSLTIKFFKGEKFPSWMFTSLDAGVGLSIYNNLIEISLKWCNKCEEIPTLGHLPCLRVLQIEGMNNVRCVGIEFYSDGNHINTLFPALRRLKMEWMDRLEEWKDAKELTTAVEVFPCLEELTICSCRKLTSLPHTCVSLQELVVQNCLDLRSLPGVLSLLQHLEIKMCGIKELPSGLQSCRSLQYLEIDNCFNLRSSHISLEKVELYGWPKLNHLPDEIQHFTALKYLDLYEFDGMEALSDWLGNLSSLQKLYLVDCKNLMYLPTEQAMGRLTKLETLEIINCPKLEERCAERSGAEWSKIARIPNIIIMGNILKGGF